MKENMYQCKRCKKKNGSKNDPKSSQVNCPQDEKRNRMCGSPYNVKIKMDQKRLKKKGI